MFFGEIFHKVRDNAVASAAVIQPSLNIRYERMKNNPPSRVNIGPLPNSKSQTRNLGRPAHTRAFNSLLEHHGSRLEFHWPLHFPVPETTIAWVT